MCGLAQQSSLCSVTHHIRSCHTTWNMLYFRACCQTPTTELLADCLANLTACVHRDCLQTCELWCAQGDEAFKCEVCNEKTEATKRLRLYRLPQVLLLHIKRFKYSGSSREKLTNNVTFPIKVRNPVCMFGCLSLCLSVMSAGLCTLLHGCFTCGSHLH